MTLPQRLLRVVPVVLLASTAYWMTTLDNDDFCRSLGECLGLSVDDLVVFVTAVIAGPLLLTAAPACPASCSTRSSPCSPPARCGTPPARSSASSTRTGSYDALVPLPAALAAGLRARHLASRIRRREPRRHAPASAGAGVGALARVG